MSTVFGEKEWDPWHKLQITQKYHLTELIQLHSLDVHVFSGLNRQPLEFSTQISLLNKSITHFFFSYSNSNYLWCVHVNFSTMSSIWIAERWQSARTLQIRECSELVYALSFHQWSKKNHINFLSFTFVSRHTSHTHQSTSSCHIDLMYKCASQHGCLRKLMDGWIERRHLIQWTIWCQYVFLMLSIKSFIFDAIISGLLPLTPALHLYATLGVDVLMTGQILFDQLASLTPNFRLFFIYVIRKLESLK